MKVSKYAFRCLTCPTEGTYDTRKQRDDAAKAHGERWFNHWTKGYTKLEKV